MPFWSAIPIILSASSADLSNFSKSEYIWFLAMKYRSSTDTEFHVKLPIPIFQEARARILDRRSMFSEVSNADNL